MQSLDVFLSRLLPSVPGCPDVLARQALVDSAIEFCEETAIIQSTSEPQAAVAETGVYDLDIPQQQVVVATLKVWYGATQLSPATADAVDSILAYVGSAGNSSPMTGTPTAFYEFSPGSIGLYPVPDTSAASMVSARISTKPSRSATSLDDLLYEDWAEAIVGGAMFRLCNVQGQAFTNPLNASTGGAKFWSDVNRAANIALRGRLRTSLAIRGRAFA